MNDEVRSMAFSPTLDETIGQGLVAAEKSLKTMQWSYLALGAVLLVIDLVVVAMEPRLMDIGIPVSLFAGMFILLGAFAKPFSRMVQKPFLKGAENANYFVARRVIADEEKLVVQYDNGILQEYPWQTLPNARMLKSVLYIGVTKQQYIVIPDRAYPDPHGWNAMLSLCATKVADNNLRPSLK